MFVTMQGVMELSISVALILGLLRKVAYVGGFLLSLLIWAVPEGFGGPYGPTSTDIGTGIVYAIGFLFLITLNTAFGPSRLSLDWLIERKWPSWKKLAEIRSASS
jgi:nitrite reductase (NO-forming)